MTGVLDQLAQFRRMYGEIASNAIAEQIIFFLKCHYTTDELMIIYPRYAAPQVVPRSVMVVK